MIHLLNLTKNSDNDVGNLLQFNPFCHVFLPFSGFVVMF